LRSARASRVDVVVDALPLSLALFVDMEALELSLVVDELFEKFVPLGLPVDAVVAVLGLALIEPVAFVEVPVPVVALGLDDRVLFGLVAGVVDVPVVAPGLAAPVPPSEVPVAKVPLEPVPLLLPVPPAPPWARAAPPAAPMMQRAAAIRVDLAFM
jgi:hypothetical protein